MKVLSYTILWCLVFLPLLSFGSAGEDTVKFNLTNHDIQALEEHNGVIWIQLIPSTALRLKKVTEKSYDKRLQIEVEGVPILQTYIYATIESGVIQIDNPSTEVRKRIKRLQE